MNFQLFLRSGSTIVYSLGEWGQIMTKLMISFCNIFPSGLALGIFDFDTSAFRWVDLSSIDVEEKIQGVTGLCFYKNRSTRYCFTTQYENCRSSLVMLDKDFNLDKIYRLSETRDAHSIVPFEDGLLITDTGGNRINRIQLGGDANFLCESEYWQYSDEQTGLVHVNSVAVFNNEVYVSLWGTEPEKGWTYARSGKIINISKNRLVCNSLFQPHSLLAIDGMLYWVESGTGKVFRYSETEGREVVMQLSGYVRGITYDDKYLYIASSAVRQEYRSTGTLNVGPSNPDDMHSWIYKISREDLKVQKRQELTFYGAEIFDLVLLDDKVQLDAYTAIDPIPPFLRRLWRYDQEYLNLKESNIALASQHDKISGDIEVQDINLRNQKTIEEKDNQISQLMNSIKIIDAQLKDALSDVVVLHNINLGHQKAIEEKDNQISQLMNSQLKESVNEEKHTELKKALRDVETLQNINLGQQKTIGEKDAALKEAIKELQRLRHEIDAIHNSISWRTLTPIKQRYDRIFHSQHNTRSNLKK
jgi:Domain of unknown function (DUF4915)